MSKLLKGRICILVTLGLSSILAFRVFIQFLGYPIVWIYVIPACLYFPVVLIILFIKTYSDDKVKEFKDEYG